MLEGNATTGITDTYSIRLAKAPTADVTIDIAYDAGQLTLASARLTFGATTPDGKAHAFITFTAANWSQAVTIAVSATDDSALGIEQRREDPGVSPIRHSVVNASSANEYDDLSELLGVEAYDDDTAGVLVQQTDGKTFVTKDGSITDTYTVRLTSAPALGATVTINPITDGQTSVAPPSLSFSSANWWVEQMVTVTGVPSFVPAPGTDNLKPFAAQPHLLSQLFGPLAVEGGVSGADRSLTDAVLLPKEYNAPLIGIGPQPDERDQIDTLNIYDDSSKANKTGTLDSVALTGYGMAETLNFGPAGVNPFGEPTLFPGGISFGQIRVDPLTGNGSKSSIEILNLMMGEGNDTLAINGTLLAATENAGDPIKAGVARHGTLTLIQGGGNQATNAGPIGGDHITVNGGGGPGSPLVIFGDTSQDALWYSGIPERTGPTDSEPWPDTADFGLKLHPQPGGPSSGDATWRFPLANPFDSFGNDVIDASGLLTSEMVAAPGASGIDGSDCRRDDLWRRGQRHDPRQPGQRPACRRVGQRHDHRRDRARTSSTATRASMSTRSPARCSCRRLTCCPR